MNITIPCYYTQEYKTKDDKTFLLSLNWYRNAFHHQQNAVKQHMHELIVPQLANMPPIDGTYSVTYNYYYKSPVSDMTNVIPMASKWLNDVLQSCKLVPNDNVKYLIAEHHYVATQDKLNPRIEATIHPTKE